jgi:hypothetical protein
VPPGVCCLNRYQVKAADLLSPAVMECLLTTIVHELIPPDDPDGIM